MALLSRSLLLLLLCTSMSISRLAAASANEEAALLAFKAVAIGGGGNGDPLASWNRSAAAGGRYGGWEGVRCWGKHRQVVELSLPSRGLTGFLSPAIADGVNAEEPQEEFGAAYYTQEPEDPNHEQELPDDFEDEEDPDFVPEDVE